MATLDTSTVLGGAVSAERYRCAEIVSAPLGGNLQLVYSKNNGMQRVLPTLVARGLALCRAFDTLENHARSRCRDLKLDPKQLPAVRGELQKLAADGLLVSERMVRERIAHAVGQAPATSGAVEPITSVVWITRDRIEPLHRNMLSFIENGQRHGRTSEFVVMDDSPDATVRENYRQMLRELKRQYSVTILYAGREEKERFAQALATAGAPAETVQFALFGMENCGAMYGANQNAVLLHTLGEKSLGVGDDSVCQFAPSPQPKNGLGFFTGADPAEFWFYPDRDAALAAVKFSEDDLLAMHERLLGRDLGSAILAFGGANAVNVGELDPQFLRSLPPNIPGESSSAGRVTVTMSGLVGDCAMSWPRWFLLAGRSRERLMQSETAYRDAFRSREILRVASQYAISAGQFCLSTAIGFDNRTLMPPLFPIGRNEDSVMGLTLRRCFPDGYFGHVPWAVLHAPQETRAFASEDMWADAASCGVSGIISLCLSHGEFGPGRTDGTQRLRILGRNLTQLGALPQSEFDEFIRVQLWRQASRTLGAFSEFLRAYRQSPDFWAKDIRQYATTLREAMMRDDYSAPRDLRRGRSADEARAMTQRLVGQFGALLAAWPEIVSATRTLQQNGVRVAQPVG